MKIQVLLSTLMLWASPVLAGNEWLDYFRGASFEAHLQDCQDGNSMAFRDCDVRMEFTSEDQFGALLGRLEIGLQDQQYDIRLEYFDNGGDYPYWLELRRPGYVRRVKASKDSQDVLVFLPTNGDMEPVQIRFFRPAGSTNFTLVFKHNQFMKGKVYSASGELIHK